MESDVKYTQSPLNSFEPFLFNLILFKTCHLISKECALSYAVYIYFKWKKTDLKTLFGPTSTVKKMKKKEIKIIILLN